MPSIRVRQHSSYSTLSEGLQSPSLPPRRSLASVFGPTKPPGAISRSPGPRLSLPVLRSSDEAPRLRPRSTTGLSRVQSHVLRNSVRNSRALTYHGRDNSTVIEEASPQPPHGRLVLPQHSERIDESMNAAHEEGWDTHHHDDIVEHLDAIDPQVGAVSTLTNAANSIVFPPTPFFDRKPIIMLPTGPQNRDEVGSMYEDALDRHVDDVIRRPSPIRRALLGVWAFLKTPMGIITGIYGFLVVFWGAAIVLFLARIINLHNDNLQGFWVEVSSQVENGLFTATSIGLIPSRVIDTYRIYKIWYYKRKTIRLRELAELPQLFDPDDLPDPYYDDNYVHVLSDKEQQDLHRQQVKFQYHQTWYRAHGGETHRAFPINIALAICFLNDGNSIFQIILCGTMWGMNRFQRPPWSTGLLIPATFLCGIAAAVLIWRGSEKTKRVEEIRQKLRDALAESETLPPMDILPPSPFVAQSEQSGSYFGNHPPTEGPEVAVNSSSEKLTQQ